MIAGRGNPLLTTQQQNSPPSFTGKAVATLIIYCFLWLPGLIANVVFYREAKEASRRYGQTVPGSGCLVSMLWLQAIGVAIGILLVISLL